MRPLRIAVTCGDPAGIGPEVAVRAVAQADPNVEWSVFGPPGPLRETARRLGVPVPKIEPCGSDESEWIPSPRSGRAALAAIDAAFDAVSSGKADAMVTAPVSKRWIAESGVPFAGHTEYLAARAGVRETTMMFASERLKVSLATTHVPLREVAGRITVRAVLRAIRQTDGALRELFGIGSPRIAVAGLNPHAGESGHLGREEGEVIGPAVEQAREAGVDARGPHSGDSVFRRVVRGEFDAAVAMYHDQGLAAVKTAAPNAVNLTLGLPFIRTSPDHGTAFEIAGRGVADPGPMSEALALAVRLALRRRDGTLV